MKTKSLLLSLLLLPISMMMNASTETFTVYNNYNYNAGEVTIDFNSSDDYTFTCNSLSAWASFDADSYDYSVSKITVDSAYGPNNTCKIKIMPDSTATSVNIYTNDIITNSSNTQLSIQLYNSTNTSTGTVLINAYQSLQLITGTASIAVYDSTDSINYIAQTTIDTGQSYQINYNGTVYSLTPYTPKLANNSTQNITVTDLYFYDSNSVQINSSALTIAPGSTANVSGQSATYTGTAYNTTITGQVAFPTENIFTANYIENDSPQNITINYSGTINGVSSTGMNTPQITIDTAQSNQIITGATSFVAYDDSGDKITFSDGSTSVNINSGLNYYLSLENDVWSYSTTNNPFTLTNNTGAEISTITFYPSESGVAISSVTDLNNNSSTPIPTGAGFAEYVIYINNANQFANPQVSDAASSNIMTGQFVYNNSKTPIYVTYNYSSIIGYFQLTAAGNGISNFGIITGTTSISVSTTNSSSGNVITGYPIVAGYSYYLNTDSNGNWVITTSPQTYTFTNNGSTNATNVTFKNSSGQQQGSTISTLNASTTTITPAINPTTISFTQTINNTATNLILPATASQDFSEFTNQTITNNDTDSTIYAIFYGNNGTSSGAFNATAIDITDNTTCKIFSTAISVSFYASSTATPTTTPLVSINPITANTSYFINESNGVWSATTAPVSYYLTNNWSTATTTPVGFADSTNQQTGSSTSTLAATTGATPIPSNSTFASFDQSINGNTSGIINTTVSDSADSNFYTSQHVYNNTGSTIYITYYGDLNNGLGSNQLMNENQIPVATTDLYAPMMFGINKFNASLNADGSSAFITSYPVDAGTSYYINYSSGTYSVTTSSTTYSLTNNGSSSATSVVFKNSSGTQQGSTVTTLVSTAGSNSTVIPDTDSTTATFTQPINGTTTNITVPLPSNGNVNIYTDYRLYNTTAIDLYIMSYGTINGVDNQPMNTVAYPITALTGIAPIITHATLIKVYSDAGATTLVYSFNINGGSDYYINYSGGVYSDSTSEVIYNLTNDYPTATGTVSFYNTNDDFISSIPSLSASGGYGPIDSSSIYAEFTQTINGTAGTITIPVSDSANSNIYTGQSVTNNASSTMWVNFYGTINGAIDEPLNSAPVQILASASAPIFTGATSFSIYSPDSTTRVVDNQLIAANTDYFVNDAFDVTTQTTIYNFRNNYSTPATNVNFFNSSAAQQGSTVETLNATDTTGIPATSTYVQLTQLIHSTTADIMVPLLENSPVNCYTKYTLNNASGQSVYVVYTGNVDGPGANPKNLVDTETAIDLTPGTSCPIITGTSSVNIYSNADATGLLESFTISDNSNYYITETNNVWSYQATYPYSLTNNSTATTGLITFFSGLSNVGTLQSLSGWTNTTIPLGTTSVVAEGLYNSTTTTNITFTIDTPINQYVNIYNPYVILNDSTSPVLVRCYKSDNITLAGQFDLAIGQAAQIVYGTAYITILNTSATMTLVTSTDISSSNSSYKITDDVSWDLTEYTPVLVNNSSDQTSASIELLNSNGQNISNGYTTVDYGDDISVPGDASYATVYYTDYTLYPSMTFANSENIFTPYTIYNSSSQSVSIQFYGYLEGNDGWLRAVSSSITLNANSSINIMTGAENVDLTANSQSIGSYDLTSLTSYIISYNATTETWSFAATYPYLINNCNYPLTNLIFYDASIDPIGLSSSLVAYGSTLIPVGAASASFTQFGASINIPVSYLASSNIYLPYQITNNDDAQTAAITFINSIASPEINVAPLTSLPILASTTSFAITSGPTVTGPYLNSYDITYNAADTPDWSITNEVVTLTNNCDQIALTISFYDSTGTIIGTATADVQPWANLIIPTGATSAVAVYTDYTVTTIVSDYQSSRIFTQNILNNNYGASVFVNYYGYLNGVSNSLLNNNPISIEAGDSVPFIRGTLRVSVIVDNVAIISQAPISSASYEITSLPTLRKLSSALATLRLLGGSMPVVPKCLAADLYGYNPLLFTEFLYVDTYAQVITDSAARVATIAAVKAILATYAADYIIQPNFNYISYLYLINEELDAAELILTIDYLNSLEEIEQFFIYFKKHAADLLR